MNIVFVWSFHDASNREIALSFIRLLWQIYSLMYRIRKIDGQYDIFGD
jgi:hypothetical protein